MQTKMAQVGWTPAEAERRDGSARFTPAEEADMIRWRLRRLNAW